MIKLIKIIKNIHHIKTITNNIAQDNTNKLIKHKGIIIMNINRLQIVIMDIITTRETMIAITLCQYLKDHNKQTNKIFQAVLNNQVDKIIETHQDNIKALEMKSIIIEVVMLVVNAIMNMIKKHTMMNLMKTMKSNIKMVNSSTNRCIPRITIDLIS